jgi:hypothetical protein
MYSKMNIQKKTGKVKDITDTKHIFLGFPDCGAG